MSVNMVGPAYAESAYALGATPAGKAQETPAAEAAEKSAAAKKQVAAEEKARQDVIDFHTQLDELAEKQREFQKMLEKMSADKAAMKPKASPPKDETGLLVQRLVAAVEPMEVRNVMMEAGRALSGLQMTAAMVDSKDRGKVEAIIRRVKKLLNRAQRKLDDLSKEAILANRQRSAAAQKQTRRAEQLKDELRSRMKARKNREQEYLNEERQYDMALATHNDAPAPNAQNERLDPAAEAQIEAMAEAQAAAEAAAGGDVAVAGTGGEAGAGSGGEAPAATGGGGGEGAAVEGGGGEAAAGGEVAAE